MKKEKQQSNWEKLIQLNLNCGCKYGVCKKCLPILEIIRAQIQKAKEIKKGESWRRGYMQGQKEARQEERERIFEEMKKLPKIIADKIASVDTHFINVLTIEGKTIEEIKKLREKVLLQAIDIENR